MKSFCKKAAFLLPPTLWLVRLPKSCIKAAPKVDAPKYILKKKNRCGFGDIYLERQWCNKSQTRKYRNDFVRFTSLV